ncbi:MAG: N-acetylmuramoyl-L-alanine amidase [Clostridia bacterium]
MKYISETCPVKKAGGIEVNTEYIQNKNCTVKEGRNISYVVMHYTGNSKDKAVNNAKYFKNNSLSSSAHYFVDDESIYQSVEIKNKAWHAGTNGTYYSLARNENSVGIEMCCENNYTVSEKTQSNAAFLCAEICKMIGIGKNEVDTFVIRHYDVTHKNCPAQWVSNEGEFIAFKERVKSLLEGDKCFSDIEGHWAENVIERLFDKGIVTGYEDNTFRPDAFITRAEMCAVIDKIVG